tara:strand:- start:84 stop:1013 length:930 start_codon:yes stop_codon:yes gene_type:complete
MAQNPFEIRGLDKNPLDELLKLNRARRSKEAKDREDQRIRDEKIVLKEIPDNISEIIPARKAGFIRGATKEQVKVGTETMDIDDPRYIQALNRNKIIEDASKRLKGGQNAQQSSSQPKTEQARMGTGGKLKQLGDNLRLSMSSFMSGNRGGQVIGKPNTPTQIDDSPMKLQQDFEKFGSGKLPVNTDNRLKNKKAEGKIKRYGKMKKEEAKRINREKLRTSLAREVSKVEVEGANLRKATKDKLRGTKNRIKGILSKEKKNFEALKSQTPSVSELVQSYIQGVKKRSGLARKAVDYALPQARVVQKKPK